MPNMVELLRRLADEYDAAEKAEEEQRRAEEIEALKQRNPERFADAFKNLSPEEKAEIVEALGIAREEPAKPKPPPSPAPPPPKDPPKGDEAPPPARTRPGRKRGRLYEYRVDDGGRVVETAVPTIYTGDDEPDEVELPADDDDGKSADDESAAA